MHRALRPAAATPAATRPGLGRVLAAVVYDAMLLFAVLFGATAALLPFTGGEAVPPGRPLFTIYLLAIAFGYLGGFWVRGGQTLGMRAWRLRATTADGAPLGWTDALARFAAAALSWLPAGAGFLWIAFDRDRLSLHDRLSGTRLVLEPRRGSPASPPASETGGAEPASGTPPGDPP